ncbi:unnamed protein product [Clonostachys solani]|uniref:Uncharacterized protein n=1 Tax=Clonostachys solani TaxID=160281 RepID=A0A9N9Z5H0_9HYPO|nr:unnamed protein product [Clonostachys solani]
MADYLYTVGGYLALAGVGYVIYQVSTQKSRRRASTVQPKASRGPQSEVRKEDRKKKQRMESFTTESQEANKAAASKPKSAETSTFLSNDPSNDTSNDDAANREFAKQLSKAKEGTKFNTKTDSGKQKEKSVKQSRANKISPPAQEVKPVASVPSSTTVDTTEPVVDDVSASNDPGETAAADSTGVADMLEPTPAAPSVLRLTDTTEKEKKKKPAKAPEPTETKKQRQNRKKAEAAKALREETEKERKVLEEKQRRTARLAEGRAAKDGSKFLASANANSAWDKGAPNGQSNKAASTNGSIQLLDTVDAPAASKPAKVKSESTWMSSLPSEEEQLEMLKDESDEWSTVKTKASKRSVKKESSNDSGDEPAQSRPAAQPKQPSASAASASKPTSSFGSFSALTSNDEPADEVEEEWDV